MSVCVRYTKNYEIFERFIGFLDVSEKQNAEALVNAVITFLKLCKLDQVQIIGQSYDGHVMSGKHNGVQAKLKMYYPFAIYIHCMAHRLNLIVVDICKNVKVSFYLNLSVLKINYNVLINY